MIPGTYRAERSTHSGMLTRCYNHRASNYGYYGGRGIQVASAWRGRGGFARFLEDVGPRPSNKHTLDRIDVNGHYKPGNVQWALRVDQAKNKRSVVPITIDGKTRVLSEWCSITGTKVGTAWLRIKKGWDPVKAVTTPASKKAAKSIVDFPEANGVRRSSEHNTYYGMRSRCYCRAEPGFKYYGAKGVTVCDQWMGRGGFSQFLRDVGPRPPLHSLDRINPEGNYEPGNTRWATADEQGLNKRSTVWLTVRGETRCLKDWSTVSGTPVRTIGNRLSKYGWQAEEAVFGREAW